MTVKLPSVLSVQRGTIVTDGVMSSIIKIADTERLEPVRVVRHGIRGILPEKSKDSVSNPQRTESAKTSPQAVGLSIDFAIRAVDSSQLIFACSDSSYRAALEGFIGRYFRRDVQEFEEVCRRYARNILNGRWLWRNRVLGEVVVTASWNDGQEVTCSGQGSTLKNFDDYTSDELKLAEVMREGFMGAKVPVRVSGRVMFGFTGEVEVFPSQNMVMKKPDGFARSLYKVDMIARRDLLAIMGTARKDGEDAGEFAADMIDMGTAALRDQKIGNAIRTIDTWYPDCDGMPISIEPNGGNLEMNKVYRDKKPASAKHLLTGIDEMTPGEVFSEEAAYLIALLVRGGVFSEKKEEA